MKSEGCCTPASSLLWWCCCCKLTRACGGDSLDIVRGNEAPRVRSPWIIGLGLRASQFSLGLVKISWAIGLKKQKKEGVAWPLFFCMRFGLLFGGSSWAILKVH
ncbi:hypothetical protein Droror1_Dr00015732 [Drosera rotundifolia]